MFYVRMCTVRPKRKHKAKDQATGVVPVLAALGDTPIVI